VSGVRYRERLVPPLLWWVLGALFALSVFAAVVVAAGSTWALAATAVALVGAGALLAAGAVVITVSDTELAVGRARLELAYVAGCVPLEADAASRRAGPEADARAYLVLRPYVTTAVEVTLDDPDDPVPYWLVSTRHPRELAAALEDARAGLAVGR